MKRITLTDALSSLQIVHGMWRSAMIPALASAANFNRRPTTNPKIA
jgi:hypothetical protein